MNHQNQQFLDFVERHDDGDVTDDERILIAATWHALAAIDLKSLQASVKHPSIVRGVTDFVGVLAAAASRTGVIDGQG